MKTANYTNFPHSAIKAPHFIVKICWSSKVTFRDSIRKSTCIRTLIKATTHRAIVFMTFTRSPLLHCILAFTRNRRTRALTISESGKQCIIKPNDRNLIAIRDVNIFIRTNNNNLLNKIKTPLLH